MLLALQRCAGTLSLGHFEGHRVNVSSRNVKDLPRREAELKTIDASAQSGYLSAIYYLTLSKPFYILDKRRLTS
jgi:hypothetical protein